MSELSPDARAILRAARDGDEPTDADRERVRAAVLGSVGGATFTGTAASSAAASGSAGATAGGAAAAQSGFGAAAIVKLAGFVVVVAGLTAGAAALMPSASPNSKGEALDEAPVRATTARGGGGAEPRPDREQSSWDPEGAVAEREASAVPREPALPREPEQRVVAEAGRPDRVTTLVTERNERVERMARVSAVDGARRSPPARRPGTQAAAHAGLPSPVPVLEPAEISLLRAANAALRAGRLAVAQEHLDEHRRRFPSGALSVERDAAYVLLLCGLGRGMEARARSQAFVSAHPGSPLAARVGSACDEPVNDTIE